VFAFVWLEYFALQPAFADPQKILEQWIAANRVEQELISLATAGLMKSPHARDSLEHAKMQNDVANILSKINDPAIALRVAHNMLVAGGNTDDRVVDEVQIEAYFLSINQVSKINTKDALNRLKLFKLRESLDGGYSVYVRETIDRMERELGK
jgi:hypothetical protein